MQNSGTKNCGKTRQNKTKFAPQKIAFRHSLKRAWLLAENRTRKFAWKRLSKQPQNSPRKNGLSSALSSASNQCGNDACLRGKKSAFLSVCFFTPQPIADNRQTAFCKCRLQAIIFFSSFVFFQRGICSLRCSVGNRTRASSDSADKTCCQRPTKFRSEQTARRSPTKRTLRPLINKGTYNSVFRLWQTSPNEQSTPSRCSTCSHFGAPQRCSIRNTVATCSAVW